MNRAGPPSSRWLRPSRWRRRPGRIGGARRGRELGTVLAAGALLAGPVAPAGAAPALPRQPAGPLPVLVSVTGMTRVTHPGSRLVVTGRIRNTGPTPLADVTVDLRFSGVPITTRSGVAAQLAAPGWFGQQLYLPTAPPPVPDLAPGASVPFRITAPVDDFVLSASGVYPLGVEARDAAGQLGLARSYLLYSVPGTPTGQLSLAWVWPLLDPPATTVDGAFLDDRLGRDVGPDGRLSRLLALADAMRSAVPATGAAGHRPGAAGALRRAVPVTLVVDPAVLSELAAMAGPHGYLVRPPTGGRPVRGDHGRSARNFLDALRLLAHRDPVLALPYGDPDVVALVRAGLDQDVGRAENLPARGQDLTNDLLGVSRLTGYYWPPQGLLTQPAVDTLASTGVGTLVLSGAALPPAPQLTYTPTGSAVVPTAAGSLRAAVSDPTLDAAATGSLGGGGRLSEQLFLADSYVIAQEAPNLPRSLVVLPPRAWSAGALGADLLGDTGSMPWLRATTVDRVAAATPTAGGRQQLRYPAGVAGAELPADYLAAVRRTESGLARMSSVLVPGTATAAATSLLATTTDLGRTLLRAESAAWRTDGTDGWRLLAGVRSQLAGMRSRVHILSGGTVSLTSRSSRIPVTIANGLPTPVRLRVGLSTNSARLVARDPGVQTIAAGQTVQVEVPVQLAADGVFPATVTLLTPAGAPFGPAVRLVLRSSAYGPLALGISGGAFAVLLVAAAVRLVRRALRARRAG